MVDTRADAGGGVGAEQVRRPAHGAEFLGVLQQRVFGQPYAGQDETAPVFAVALNHVKGDGGAAADDAERFVCQAARAKHGEVAVGAEGMRLVVGDGEGVVGFFLCDEGL